MKNDISITKVTHAGRVFAAQTARSHGASVSGTKALGCWSESGAYAVYDRGLPLDAMLAAAMFNGRKPENYFMPRSALSEFQIFRQISVM